MSEPIICSECKKILSATFIDGKIYIAPHRCQSTRFEQLFDRDIPKQTKPPSCPYFFNEAIKGCYGHLK